MDKMYTYELKEDENEDEYFTENGFLLSPRIIVQKLERLQELESQLAEANKDIEIFKLQAMCVNSDKNELYLETKKQLAEEKAKNEKHVKHLENILSSEAEVLMEEYALWPDEKLSPKAIEMKQKIIKSISQAKESNEFK